jgi:putative cardiolipin synthase
MRVLPFGPVPPLSKGNPPLPPPEGRGSSGTLSDAGDTRLGRGIGPKVAAHPGKSGIYALPDAREAFAARVLLARAADRTLDVQYYIWHRDMTGTLLMEALCAAADRGVRVRLLLDDNNTSGLDTILAMLDSHPNIEVRLFNPFVTRRLRAFGYLTDFARLNRRMHNKSFTADNQATVVGGRNVGDEYFGATDDVLFADLDVLAVGPVVNEVSSAFELYWSSASSRPAARVLPAARSATREELASAARRIETSAEAEAYTQAVRNSTLVQALAHGTLEMEWAVAHAYSDDPAKGLGKAPPAGLLTSQLEQVLGPAATDFELISPYFVPTGAGVAWFKDMARRGVKIKVLTNALEATDVPFVHAGYSKRRKALLKAGIKLYELRRSSEAGSGSSPRPKGSVGSGSSGSSLHAKTCGIDRARVFVGSFNFDPRSAKLNTEMGIVIESVALAQMIGDVFRDRIPIDSYEVRLSDGGELVWMERGEEESIRHDREPGTRLWQRVWVRFLSVLPIEWLL